MRFVGEPVEGVIVYDDEAAAKDGTVESPAGLCEGRRVIRDAAPVAGNRLRQDAQVAFDKLGEVARGHDDVAFDESSVEGRCEGTVFPGVRGFHAPPGNEEGDIVG